MQLWRRRLLTGVGAGVLLAPLSELLKPSAALAQTPDLPPILPGTINQRFALEEMCVLTPQAVEGPFYVERAAVRSDIRDGQPGQLLKLRFQVVNANDMRCGPVAGAAVSIWQCNIDGFYSGHLDQTPDRRPDAVGTPRDVRRPSRYPPSGSLPPVGPERFLRGVQVTDANGMVEFTTIFPAWYGVRVPHIHAKVFLNERDALTTQLFFPQSLMNAVLTQGIYARRGLGYATNENDIIRRQAGLSGDRGMFRMSYAPDQSLIGSSVLGVPHI